MTDDLTVDRDPKIGEILNKMREDGKCSKPYYSYHGEVVIFERIELNDGTSISIQAGADKYCTPRVSFDDYTYYTHFECGFAMRGDKYFVPFFLKDFAESVMGNEKGKTVYPYVPNSYIDAYINACRGVK